MDGVVSLTGFTSPYARHGRWSVRLYEAIRGYAVALAYRVRRYCMLPLRPNGGEIVQTTGPMQTKVPY